jgi:hypothetical protein
VHRICRLLARGGLGEEQEDDQQAEGFHSVAAVTLKKAECSMLDAKCSMLKAECSMDRT